LFSGFQSLKLGSVEQSSRKRPAVESVRREVEHVCRRGGDFVADVRRPVTVGAEMRERTRGEVVDAETVFEASVVRRGVDETDRRELLYLRRRWNSGVSTRSAATGSSEM
jgi:hypothetical protein